MGLFSFGNKEGKRGKRASDQDSAPFEVASEEDRPSARQQTALDPLLPEKQRARRRLIGALVLIVAAIVVLPMILDAQPKPAPDDIAIQIPKSAFESCPEGQPSALCEEAMRRASSISSRVSKIPAVTSTANLAKPQSALGASTPSPQNVVTQSPVAQSAPVAAAVQRAKEVSPSKPKPVNTSVSSSVKTSPNAKAPIRTASTTEATHSRFAIKLANFADKQRAISWFKRLKQANVPVYLEHKKLNERNELWLLRAGPFNDKASAQAALKRIRAAGFPVAGKAPQAIQKN